MYSNLTELLDLLIFIIGKGFSIACVVGFIAWGFWYVVSMFKSIAGSGG